MEPTPEATAKVKKLCSYSRINSIVGDALDSEAVRSRETLLKNEAQWPPIGDSQQILRAIEKSIFGRAMFSIADDFPGLSGSTYFRGRITVSRRTYEAVQNSATQPQVGLSFMIAHEIGHYLETVFKDDVGLSAFSEQTRFNVLHAQTDCLALNILERARIPFSIEDIDQALLIVKNECHEVQPKAFCDQADNLRKTAVRIYSNDSH